MRTSKNYDRPRLIFPTKLFLFVSLAVVGIVLADCMPVQPVSTPSATITTLPTFTSVAPLYTPTLGSPNILTASTPISSPAPIPISTATETFPLDNLRMAYIVDGNLYVQDGSNPSQKLSDSGKNWYPVFSDDGGKIVFYRGEKINDNNNIFSVNADGSRMQEIITTAWLDTLDAGTKAGHLAFIPNTHQLVFNTYLCPEFDPSSTSGCTVGLFLVDSDTGKIKKIMKPALGGWLSDEPWIRNFSISPDGKLLSISHAGKIDIFDMEGNIIRQSIMKYPPGMPFELYARVYWLPDSSGLIIALPTETDFYGPRLSGDPTYSIWRYLFDGDVATPIPLNPPLSWAHMESNDIISISPNREWVIYLTEDYKLYKGNLLDGNTNLLLPYRYFLPMLWSLDNIHFAHLSNPEGNILASVKAPPGYPPGQFLGWIDRERFIYFPYSTSMNKDNIPVLVGEVNGENIKTYETKVFVPHVAPYSYSFAFAILEIK